MSKPLILYASLVSIYFFPLFSPYPQSKGLAAEALPVGEQQEIKPSKSPPNNPISIFEQKFVNKTFSKGDLAELITLVEKNPQNSQAHLLLANCCDSLGLPLQAMDQYKLAFKYGPNNADSFLELIKALMRSGQLTAASALLKQGAQKFPAHPQILFWTGNALYSAKRYDEAAALYEEAFAKSNKPIIGLPSAMGNIYLQQGNYTKAYQMANIDLSYNRYLPQANELMGLILFRSGRIEKASPFLAVAFKYDPDNYTLASAYAQSLTWTGKYSDALIPALIAFAKASGYQNVETAKITVDQIIPRLSKRVVKENVYKVRGLPSLAHNAQIHLLLARICLSKGVADLALNECLIATKLNPSDSIAKYRLALILENYTHEYGLSLQYLRQAHVLEPYNPQIKQHLMRLEDRLTISKSDWAWRVKDWLTNGIWQSTSS